jgi:hypothetical protein
MTIGATRALTEFGCQVDAIRVEEAHHSSQCMKRWMIFRKGINTPCILDIYAVHLGQVEDGPQQGSLIDHHRPIASTQSCRLARVKTLGSPAAIE